MAFWTTSYRFANRTNWYWAAIDPETSYYCVVNLFTTYKALKTEVVQSKLSGSAEAKEAAEETKLRDGSLRKVGKVAWAAQPEEVTGATNSRFYSCYSMTKTWLRKLLAVFNW